MPPADDHELLARAAAGDRDAFEVFVRRWDGPLERFLRRATGAASADDARNATFLRVLRRAGSFRGGSVKSWLFRIAWRTAVDARRRKLKLSKTQPLPAEAGAANVINPAAAAEINETQAAARRALEWLDPKDRALVWLCAVEAMPIEEAARVLGRPASTLRYRLAKALAALRRKLTNPDPISINDVILQ